MASPTVHLLTSDIILVLENEASLLGWLADEIYKIKMEFISMRSFVERFPRRGRENQGGITSSTTSCITRIGSKIRVSTLCFWINHLHSQEYLCEASNCSKIKKEPFCIMILEYGWKVMATPVFSSKMSSLGLKM